MKVEREIEIAAPPQRVYGMVMDPHRLEDWVTIHERLEHAPDGELREGSTLRQRLRLAGQGFSVSWTVEQADERHVIWEGSGPVASSARVEYRFSANGKGTRFGYLNEYELPGGILGRLAGRTVAGRATRETEASLERLKALLERES